MPQSSCFLGLGRLLLLEKSPLGLLANYDLNVTEIEVGKELRRRRNEMGMTLRELATESGLTTGFLSQVENNQVSPSLKSLSKMAKVLRVPIFHLLSTTVGDPVIRASERPPAKLPGTTDEVALLTPFSDWQLLPFQRDLKPRESFDAVHLDRAREEWIMVLTGTVRIELGDDGSHVLNEGDSIHFESSRLTHIANPTDAGATYLCIMTPPAL